MCFGRVRITRQLFSAFAPLTVKCPYEWFTVASVWHQLNVLSHVNHTSHAHVRCVPGSPEYWTPADCLLISRGLFKDSVCSSSGWGLFFPERTILSLCCELLCWNVLYFCLIYVLNFYSALKSPFIRLSLCCRVCTTLTHTLTVITTYLNIWLWLYISMIISLWPMFFLALICLHSS